MTDSTRDIAAAIRREVIPEGAKRLGLVIGIDRYQDERLNLRCARADAEAMHNLMVDPECGLFEADNVTVLADEDATRERIWRALAGLRRKAHKQDSVWIFYAGHGAPEGDDFFWVPHDGDVDDLYSTGLSRRDLNRVLDDMLAERIVAFLDCCHAAAMAVQKNRTRSIITAETAFSAYSGRGRIVFAASNGPEKSVEISQHGRGAFSYFLEKGLRGEADESCRGIVTADDLWLYLKGKVSQAAHAAGNSQTPVRIGEETHDFALSVNPHIFGETKRLAGIVAHLASAKHLTQEEEMSCYQILREGFATPVGRAICKALERNDAEGMTVKRVREIVQSYLEAGKPVIVKPVDNANQLYDQSLVLPTYKEWCQKQSKKRGVGPEVTFDIMLTIAILVITGVLLKKMTAMFNVVLSMLAIGVVIAPLILWWRNRSAKNRYRLESARLCMKQANYGAAKSFIMQLGRVGVDRQDAEKLTLAVADQALIIGQITLAYTLYRYAVNRWASSVAEAKLEAGIEKG